MQNLRQPVTKILLQSIDAYKVGMFTDTISGRKVLSFKEYGVNIPGDVRTAGTGVPLASGTLATGLVGSKSCTDPGELAFKWVEFSPPCTCGTCGWEWGISIHSYIKNAKDNDWGPEGQTRSYSGITEAVSCSGIPSMIDDAYVLAAEDDIITQITNDTGFNGNNTDPSTSRSMSPVEARRVYVCSDVLAGSAGIDITIDGVTTPIATPAGVAIDMVEDINGTIAVHDEIVAFGIQNTDGTRYTFAIMSRTPGRLFTVAANGAGSATIDHRYVALNSKSVDVHFDVIYSNDMGATTTKHTIQYLTGNTAIGTTTTTATINGVPTASAAANDAVGLVSAYAIAIQATLAAVPLLLADTAASWDSVSGYTMVYGNTDVSKVSLTFSATSTTSIADSWSGNGSWPILTGKDVFRVFANKNDAGNLYMYQYLDQVNPEDEYCMYDLKFNRDIYAIHGSSHIDHYLEHVQIYIKSSLLTTDVWDANIFTPAGLLGMVNYNIEKNFNSAVTTAWTPDTNFDELLTIWAGVAPTSW